MSFAKCLLAVFLALQLVGCSGNLDQEIASSDEGRFVLRLLDLSKTENGISLKALLNSEIQKDPDKVEGMTGAIRKFSATDFKLEAFLDLKQRYASNIIWATEVKVLFLKQPDYSVAYVVDFVIQKEGNANVLRAIRVDELQSSAHLSINEQLLRVPTQLKLNPGFAALAVLSFSLTVAGFWAALYGTGMKHRWAWAALSLFGLGIVSTSPAEVGWSADFFSFICPPVMLSSYKLFSAGFYLVSAWSTQLETSPTGLYISLPIGAIVTLATWDDKRRARLNQ
jgi:hypothetical protein